MEKKNDSALVQILPCIRRRKQFWPDRQAPECTRAKQKGKESRWKDKGASLP